MDSNNSGNQPENDTAQDANVKNFQTNYSHDHENLEPVMSVGQWLLIALVMSIPCVNIIMLFVWGFSSANETRANYCKAALILWIVGILLVTVFSVVLGMYGGVSTSVPTTM